MSWFEIVTDRKIRVAQQEGLFDNLPGKGRPLDLDQDLRVPPEQRVAYRLMRDAKILPDWIQADKEIRQRQEELASRIEQYEHRREEELARSSERGGEDRPALDGGRERFLLQITRHLLETNRLIERLNLIVPGHAQQRLRIDVEQQVSELEARFPRLTPYLEGESAPWRALLPRKQGEIPNLGNRMPLRRRRESIG